MRNNTGTKLITLLALLSPVSIVFADVTLPTLNQTAPTNTNATAFGIQAGAIAGTAQSCGQDISTFTTRASEAINKLAANNTDKVLAISAFQKSLQQAQVTESNNHTIPCSQVLQDYNNLPLLRDDYEQTVIAQLNPNMTSTGITTPTTQQTNPNPQGSTNYAAPAPANGAKTAGTNTGATVTTTTTQTNSAQPGTAAAQPGMSGNATPALAPQQQQQQQQQQQAEPAPANQAVQSIKNNFNVPPPATAPAYNAPTAPNYGGPAPIPAPAQPSAPATPTYGPQVGTPVPNANPNMQQNPTPNPSY